MRQDEDGEGGGGREGVKRMIRIHRPTDLQDDLIFFFFLSLLLSPSTDIIESSNKFNQSLIKSRCAQHIFLL